ncbi:MAG TPA: 2-phosphosulfolactate phosphatase [Acidimicrobiales bacterium]|nr:2-phosphosulfolactate phosphatase [Acidimicrobiales bacterium]
MRSVDPRHGPASVTIDAFPESVSRYGPPYTIVAVDVIRSTTMAVTAAADGWRCLPVPTLEQALGRAKEFPDSLLAGELGGQVPYEFDMDNSPVELLARSDRHRPLVLLSTSGTRVICGATAGQEVHVACLRNHQAQVGALTDVGGPVAVIGAGARGEFRDEDALCCAWIARDLVQAGFVAADANTSELIERWDGVAIEAITTSGSAEFLRSTDRQADLDFVLDHVNDIPGVVRLVGAELIYEVHS